MMNEARRAPIFLGSDAWLLLALLYGREPADAETLRQWGDAINHAIFTDEELEGGLRRLKEAGHVIEEEGRFRTSPDVVAWFDRVSPRRSAIHKELERAEGFLGVGSEA